MATTELEAPSRGTALRVLVIDDDANGAEALCAVLASMGCSTAVAFNGTQGLRMATAFEPHLAFIDLEMPDMSGCDVVRALRCGSAQSAACLVCLTGRGQPEDRRACMAAGFDDFFTKPVRPDKLSHVVAAALANAGTADLGARGS